MVRRAVALRTAADLHSRDGLITFAVRAISQEFKYLPCFQVPTARNFFHQDGFTWCGQSPQAIFQDDFAGRLFG
jgi:hypothetical protein